MNSTNKLVVIGVACVAAIGIVAWLAFGFFEIQTAFTNDEVSEAGPAFAGADSDEFEAAMTEAEGEEPTKADDEIMDGEIATLQSGRFAGVSRYSVTGDALVLNDGSEQRFLRLENFESSNGPDLNVYLRAEDDEFIDLGDLKGNIGDQNYEVPADVDLERYDTVEIWCVRFGVLFGEAPLA